MGYHFFEWFAAICLYEERGYLSLVEKYAYKVHAEKRKIFQSLVPASVFDFVTKSRNYGYGGRQAPDLLVYKPDHLIGSSVKSRDYETDRPRNRSSSSGRWRKEQEYQYAISISMLIEISNLVCNTFLLGDGLPLCGTRPDLAET